MQGKDSFSGQGSAYPGNEVVKRVGGAFGEFWADLPDGIFVDIEEDPTVRVPHFEEMARNRSIPFKISVVK
jgi:hypothetical protein